MYWVIRIRELERLRLQAKLVDPITRQFLTEAGIVTGMRVLDIGSGAGDVAFSQHVWSDRPARSSASIAPPQPWREREPARRSSRFRT